MSVVMVNLSPTRAVAYTKTREHTEVIVRGRLQGGPAGSLLDATHLVVVKAGTFEEVRLRLADTKHLAAELERLREVELRLTNRLSVRSQTCDELKACLEAARDDASSWRCAMGITLGLLVLVGLFAVALGVLHVL